jgi:hypothetical protein
VIPWGLPRLSLGKRTGASLLQPEGYITGERAPGCCHLNLTGGCSLGHGGLDFGFRYDLERRRSAVKSDGGRGSEIGSQNDYGRARFSRGGRVSTNGPSPYVRLKTVLIIVNSTIYSCPVEFPVRSLRQCARRISAVSTVGLSAKVVNVVRLPPGVVLNSVP